MKARILSAIIFDIENPIIHEKTCKKLIFQKKENSIFFKKKIFDQKFFIKNFVPPQIFFLRLFKTPKWKITRRIHLWALLFIEIDNFVYNSLFVSIFAFGFAFAAICLRVLKNPGTRL